MKKTLAIFDFCETLVDFQSLGRFLEIAEKHNLHYKTTKFQRRFFPRIYRRIKLGIFNYEVTHFEQLRGLKVELVEELAKKYFEEGLLKRINSRVIERLKVHQQNGDFIIIVSGGLEIYIKHFAKYFGINNVVAIELESKNGTLTGRIDGIHSMCERKLYKLEQRLNLSEFDLAKSWVYSDCVSDTPLFSLVGNRVAIKTSKNMRWAEILGYEIL